MARLRDKAPGPDGIPYSAWKAGGAPAEQCIIDLVEAMTQGRRIPGLNDPLFVFAPKPEAEGAEESTTAKGTRPRALKDSGVKIATAVVNRPVRVVMIASITPSRRGFVGGPGLRPVAEVVPALDP